MIEINDNSVIISKEDGTEDVWKLYFYYENEERGKTYYFLYKEEDEDSLIVMASEDGESLEMIDDDELKEAEEVLAAYESDPKIEAARS